MSSRIARVTVTYAPTDPWLSWTKEVWEQTGIISNVVSDGWAKLTETDVLVLIGNGTTTPPQRDAINKWCLAGDGAVVCIGGTWGLDELLGVTPCEKPSVFSRQDFSSEHEPFAELGKFSFIGGPRVTSSGKCKVLAQTQNGEDLMCINGHAYLFAPDLGKTLSLFGLGSSVGTHKIGPGDGTTPEEDGYLRAPDGTVLEWSDREEFGKCKAFPTAHIDLMREAMVRTMVMATDATKVSLGVIWHWPDNAHAATICSIDWDSSKAEHMRKVIGVLAKFGVPATWLGTPAGQPQDLYRGLRQWNHDFGLLYKPENGQLKSEQLRIQYVNISRLSSSRIMAACRGYDNYWHGLTVIYEGIEGTGGLVSYAKGGMTKGTTGFTFGTTRPYFPVARTGRSIPVLEVPFSITDPGVITSTEFIAHAIPQTRMVGGSIHFTLKTSASSETGFDDGMETMLSLMRQNRFQAFLGERLYEFEKTRRGLKFVPRGYTVNMISERACSGITIMIQGHHQPVASGKRHIPTSVERYGTTFSCATIDVDQRSQTSIVFTPAAQAA